ncbi:MULTISPECIES: hypothetical protein [Haloarcula]|uniref:hypothetical protein n=1 Tax=Haloarcula TaxID=2237 RepID=UPI0023E87E62|nr:hypothetical protein [Halomicroarcula sp. SHR3]
MNLRSYTDIERGDSGAHLARRRGVLAAGGALALGALAGCSALEELLGSASERVVTARTAAPAAFYTGDDTLDAGEGGQLYRSGTVEVRYVPPTLQADARSIDIEGWSTSAPTKARDYNSSRSNKPSSVWWPGPDDEDGDTGVLVLVLDMERGLSVHLDGAIDAVANQSKTDAKKALDAFADATTEVRAELDGCPSDVCMTVRENADIRKGLAEDARASVNAGEWDQAARSLQQARRIVDSDIERLSEDLDSDGDGISDAAEPLYEYLDGEPTIGERFVVSLPDARVRGGDTALADELTPRRVLDYFVGERGAERCGESDRTVAVHRDLACRDLLTATLDEQKKKTRAVAAFETSDGVVVTGATPAAEDVAAMLFVSDDGSVRVPETLDSWGEERRAGEASVTPTLVCPAAARPPECPLPMPALFYVRRIRHEDQLVFAGGWLLDDGALYEDTATLLVADGPNIVAGVTRSDVESGGVELNSTGDDSKRRKRPGRTKYADMTVKAPYDPDAEYLPDGSHPVCRADGELYCWGVQSREALAGSGDCDDGDATVTPHCVVTALDAPVLHLVGAADESNEVKFKAGAELSKAVH